MKKDHHSPIKKPPRFSGTAKINLINPIELTQLLLRTYQTMNTRSLHDHVVMQKLQQIIAANSGNN